MINEGNYIMPDQINAPLNCSRTVNCVYVPEFKLLRPINRPIKVFNQGQRRRRRLERLGHYWRVFNNRTTFTVVVVAAVHPLGAHKTLNAQHE